MTKSSVFHKIKKNRSAGLRKVLIWILLSFAVFLAAAVLFIHLSPVRARVLRIISDQLSRSAGVSLSAGKLEYNLFQMRFTLREASLRDAARPEQPPFLDMEGISIKLRPSSLTGGYLRIKGIVLENPRLALLIDEEGRSNLPPFKSSGSKPAEGLFGVFIERFDASGFDLVLKDAGADVSLQLSDLLISGKGSPEGALALKIAMEKPGAVRAAGREFRLDSIQSELVLSTEGILLSRLSAAVAGLQLEAEGGVDLLANPVLDITIEGSLDAETMFPEFARRNNLAGRILLSGHVTGAAEAPEVSFRAGGSGLVAGPAGLFDFVARGSWSNGNLDITSFDAESGGARLTGEARLVAAGIENPGYIRLQWADLDLGLLAPFLPEGIQIASIGTGWMEARWKDGDFSQALVKGELDLSPRKASRDARTAVLEGKIRASAEGKGRQITAENLILNGIRIGAALRDGEDGLNGTFSLSGEIWKAAGVMSGFLPVSGSDFLSKNEIEGAFRITGQISGSMEKPVIESSLKVQGSFRNDQDVLLEGRGTYAEGRIRLETGLIKLEEGELRMSGLFPLDRGDAMAVTLTTEGLDLAPVAKAFFPEIMMSGRLNVQGGITGAAARPVISARGELRQGGLSGFSWENLGFILSFSGQELRINSLTLDQGQGHAAAEGMYRLSDRTYALKVKADSWPLSGIHLPGLKIPLGGFFRAEVSGEGDLDSPDIQAEVEAIGLEANGSAAGDLRLTASVSQNEVLLEGKGFGAQGDGIDVILEGRISSGLRGLEDIEAKLSADLSRLAFLFDGNMAQGLLQAEYRGAFPPQPDRSAASFSLSGGRFAVGGPEGELGDIQVEGILEEGMIRLQKLSLNFAGGKVTAEGRFPVSSIMPGGGVGGAPFERWEASARIADVEPSLLSRYFPDQALPELGGMIGLELGLGGTDFRISSLNATSRWKLNNLTLLAVPIFSEQPLLADIREGVLILHPFELSHRFLKVSGQGRMDLTGAGGLSFSAETRLDLSSLSLPEDKLRMEGNVAGDVRISGNPDSPNFQGGFDLTGIGLQMRNPGLFLSRMNGRIKLEGEQIRIENVSGELNGGRVSLSGRISPFQALDMGKLSLSIDKMFLDYPEGLQSMLSAGLELSGGSKGGYDVRGDVWIEGASFEDELSLKSPLVRSLLQPGSAVRADIRKEKEVPVRIKLGIRTRDPIRVNNNIAEAEIRAELSLEGSLISPRLSGRAVVEEGGKITFAQNTFVLEQGDLDFISPDRIEPDLNIKALTRVQDYDVRLEISGPASSPQALLTSDPPLSEPDIISLLLTGRTLDSMSSSLLDTAGNQALTYLNNALTGRLEKAAMRGLGLENVSIDAGLLSSEEDPSARITVGQHITRQLDLSLSQNLKDARNRTWILNYNPQRNINLQGMKRDRNSFSLALRHEVRFGGQKGSDRVAWKKSSLDRAGQVLFSGELRLPERLLRKSIKFKRGKRFNFYDERRAVVRLLDLYSRHGYLTAKIVTLREQGEKETDLTFQISAGPRIELRYQGAEVSRRTRKEVRHILKGSRSGLPVFQKAARVIKSELLKKGYYRAEVDITSRLSGQETVLLLAAIKPGRRFDSPDIRFSGNSKLSDAELWKMLRRESPLWRTFLAPEKSASILESILRGRGYLEAVIGRPEFKFFEGEDRAEIGFALQEGERYFIQGVEVEGNALLDSKAVLASAGLQKGSVFTDRKLVEAEKNIRSLYEREGFQELSVRLRPDFSEKPSIPLKIMIVENRKFFVQDIRVRGNRRTKDTFLKSRLDFRAGDALSYRTINSSRKNLYDLGLFSRVDIDISHPAGEGEDPISGTSAAGPGRQPCLVEVTVREIQPYRLRYGLLYDTEAGAGAKAEIIRRNAGGRGLLLGASGRISEEEQGARVFLHAPTIFGRKISTEFYSFWEKNRKPSFDEHRVGLALQQTWPLTASSILSANFSLENDKIISLPGSAAGDHAAGVTLGTISLSFSRDTRDSLLDSKGGTLFTQNAEISPGLFSTRSRYIRLFSQFYFYRKIKGSLVYASGVRIGAGSGLSRDLLSGKRFFAGGGTSVRGFGKFELGPKAEETGLPVGGEGVVIINQELRFHLYKSIGGAVFFDLGNVYERLKDFNPMKMRSTAGAGLRWNTPYFLLRFDWGFKLDRRAGETPWRMFFSIGQAF